MMLLIAEVIPLTIVWNVFVVVDTVLLLIVLNVVLVATPLILDVIVFEFVEVETDNTLLLIIDDVEVTPLTFDVNVFVAEDKLLLVLDATRFVRSVLVATPFTEVVRVVPFVEIPFEEITEVVATTPLTVVVRVLPVTD